MLVEQQPPPNTSAAGISRGAALSETRRSRLGCETSGSTLSGTVQPKHCWATHLGPGAAADPHSVFPGRRLAGESSVPLRHRRHTSEFSWGRASSLLMEVENGIFAAERRYPGVIFSSSGSDIP